jgi:hypothetical protein
MPSSIDKDSWLERVKSYSSKKCLWIYKSRGVTSEFTALCEACSDMPTAGWRDMPGIRSGLGAYADVSLHFSLAFFSQRTLTAHVAHSRVRHLIHFLTVYEAFTPPKSVIYKTSLTLPAYLSSFKAVLFSYSPVRVERPLILFLSLWPPYHIYSLLKYGLCGCQISRKR